MNKTSTCGLRGLCAILVVALLVVAAGGGLAVVGLRLQAAQVADEAQALEHKIARAQSELRELTTAVVEAEQPDVLRARVGASLAPMVERQIVWVRPDSSPLRNSPSDAAPTQTFPFRVSVLQPAVLLAQAQ